MTDWIGDAVHTRHPRGLDSPAAWPLRNLLPHGHRFFCTAHRMLTKVRHPQLAAALYAYQPARCGVSWKSCLPHLP